MPTSTPNMNLLVPIIGTDTGLVWEQSMNSNTAVLDAHNHSGGNGSPIPPAGLLINSDLTFGNNSATDMMAVVFDAQTAFTTSQSIYVKGVDLYYRDGSGNEVQITAGAAVNATSSGISDGTATASFVASTLVVNAASLTPANIQAGSILLGNNTSGSKFLTLSPPNAMAANYALTLPALPGATKILGLDVSGNITANVDADNSTLQFTTNVLSVKSGGIGDTQIANNSITGSTKLIVNSVTTDKILSLTATKVNSTTGQITATESNGVNTPGTSFVSFASLANISITTGGAGRALLVTIQATQDGGFILNNTDELHFRISDSFVGTQTYYYQQSVTSTKQVPVMLQWVLQAGSSQTQWVISLAYRTGSAVSQLVWPNMKMTLKELI